MWQVGRRVTVRASDLFLSVAWLRLIIVPRQVAIRLLKTARLFTELRMHNHVPAHQFEQLRDIN